MLRRLDWQTWRLAGYTCMFAAGSVCFGWLASVPGTRYWTAELEVAAAITAAALAALIPIVAASKAAGRASTGRKVMPTTTTIIKTITTTSSN
jgi:hypothetical protein